MIASINQTGHAREIERQQSRRFPTLKDDSAKAPSWALQKSRQTIADHPVAALAVAAAVGLAAGLLIKRS